MDVTKDDLIIQRIDDLSAAYETHGCLRKTTYG